MHTDTLTQKALAHETELLATSTREQRLAAYLAALVQIPNVSDDFAANFTAVDYLAEFFARRGMHVERLEWAGSPALFASPKPTKHVAVLLAAHVDVVPAGAEMFQLTRKNGRFYGRGTMDMKGAIAAYMELTDTLGDLRAYDFGILITSDEENAGKALAGKNSAKKFLEAGYSADVCILPDGGDNWKIERGCKGYLHYTLEARGTTGHGSRPWLSDNAAYKLLDAVQELRTRFAGQGPSTTTFNVGAIEGGRVPNQVPDYMRAEIDIRPASAAELHELETWLPAMCETYGVSATQRVRYEPLMHDTNHPLHASFCELLAAALGKPTESMVSFGGSDAHYFVEQSIPCIVFYPEGAGHHSEEEWVADNALDIMHDVFVAYLTKHAKQA